MATTPTLAQPHTHSHFPEGGSLFETRDQAEGVIDKLFKGKMETRIEPYKDGFVIKFWPLGKSHICQERRWAKIVTRKNTRRKQDGESED